MITYLFDDWLCLPYLNLLYLYMLLFDFAVYVCYCRLFVTCCLSLCFVVYSLLFA